MAARFVNEAYRREGSPKSVILHHDNGSPMTGATLLATLHELQNQPSYSRPYVSDDNPYSESAFGTMKTRPEYPTRPFANLEDAQSWVDVFVAWYNGEHRHSRIGFVTPNQRHSEKCEELLRRRRRVYEAARKSNPGRWSGNVRAWNVRDEVFLNPDRETLDRLRN